MGVKLQSSLGGSVEIAAPVTASNYTLTAPTTSSTIDTLARTGNVLQVVQGSTSTGVTTTSTSFVTTGLSATITPTSAGSKILIIVAGGDWYPRAIGTSLYATLYRNSTNLFNTYGFGRAYYTAYILSSLSTTFLDSPMATTATTYSVYFRSDTGTSVTFMDTPTTANITLMEIAG